MNRNFVIRSGIIGTTVALAVGIWTAFGPSGLSQPNWGLHIVILDVGQADAIVMAAPNGQAAVIDAGHGSTAAGRIAGFLSDEQANGVGDIDIVKLGFVTHYDLDHMGGIAKLIDDGIEISSVYDQGPSWKRRGATRYIEYLAAVGDLNDNMIDDDDPDGNTFVRKKARVGLHWKLGDARVRCVSVRGDTKGRAYDDPNCDPVSSDVDENPGSIALLVTLGDFEFYTAGDQTSDDWKHEEPDTEIAVVKSGVLGADNDVDVVKVSHHGSDTSTGSAFVNALDAEVGVISAKYSSRHKLPKMISIKQLVDNDALVYITGDGHDPQTGTFAYSDHAEDDNYNPPEGTVFNEAGDVHIFVSPDGSRYRVLGGDTWREFSAVDSDNTRQ